MAKVVCPKCGAPMVLRTARRGPYAGKKFYGCSRYPRCKATLPYNEEKINQSRQIKEEKKSLLEVFFPRILIAKPRFEGYQVKFFETGAVPEEVLEMFNSDKIDEEIMKAFTQWRLDFPIKENEPNLTNIQRQMISVLLKILTRGRVTLISPYVEKKLEQLFNPEGFDSYKVSSILNAFVLKGYNKNTKPMWFDNKEERIFYEKILPEYLGENYYQYVIPYVDISSFIHLNNNKELKVYRKIDFAIFHPMLEEKIAIEIDGIQNKGSLSKEFKSLLEDSGFTFIKIPVGEIYGNYGKQLSLLSSKLLRIKNESYNYKILVNKNILKFLLSIKIVHQIQITLLQSIYTGFLNLENVDGWKIFSDLDEIGVFNKRESALIFEIAITDFMELLRKLSELYSIDLKLKDPICNLYSNGIKISSLVDTVYISFTDKYVTNLPTFHIQNLYCSYHLAKSSFPSQPLDKGLTNIKEDILKYFLQYLFRKQYFWEGQYDGISRVLQGKDALLLLPTGAGKSLVYQLASLLLPGRTVVIDPIISLMEDQIDNLSMIGIDRCIAITSQIENPEDRARILQLFGQGEYLFAYIAPERFQTVEFRESLRQLTVYTPIALIVVDEAHCVSEWGHDFRTAYLNIGRVSRDYCSSYNKIPPLLALTGTASRAVLKDVQRELQIEDFDAIITPKTFDRPELKFHVIYSKSQEKMARLKGYLGQVLPSLFNITTSNLFQPMGRETYAGLVFCPHVGGEFGVEEVAEEISKNLGISTAIYSGKEPKTWDSKLYSDYKKRITKEFKRNKIPLMVCTKAFGMGIDKPNIRYTIHYGFPPSVESFYQEAGRAGRDKKTAHCCIIVSNDYPERTKKLLDPNTPIEEISDIIDNRKWGDDDDITRIMYFHTNAFRGISKEKQDIEKVIDYLGEISESGMREVMFSDIDRNIVEKAIHRLLIIGVISDYTIDYSTNKFNIKLSGSSKEEIIEAYGNYVAGYLYSRKQIEVEKASVFLSLPYREFILKIVNLLLNFIYDVIERGRRRALYEMLLVCDGFPTDNDIRQRILRYLETTEYSESLEEVINDIDSGLFKCRDVFNSIRSPNEAAELRGQVSRYLESYPDQPALLMLRSLSEMYARNGDKEVVKQNFIASVSSALNNYGIKHDKVNDFIAWGISNIAKQSVELARDLILEFIKLKDRELARVFIKNLPINLIDIPAWFLVVELEKDCKDLVTKTGG